VALASGNINKPPANPGLHVWDKQVTDDMHTTHGRTNDEPTSVTKLIRDP